MKILINISRFITGAVFVFSGFVKAVDPLGSTYKFTDYFTAFQISFLEILALPLAIILASLEFLIGISMLLGYRYRTGVWGLLIFMSFFTVLTFILALTNPVSDCGCFGDAIVLTNWQTFFKNLILLPFVGIVFISRKRINTDPSKLSGWLYLSLFALMIVGFQIHALRHLPLIDFRPYGTGTHIVDKMVIPEGAPADEYKTTLYYEKNGEIREFTEENFPWQDTTWKFVDSRHILIKKGYEPPIHDFIINDEDGNDLTDFIIEDPNYSMLLISYDLKKADKEALKKGGELAAQCKGPHCSFYGLTSSSWDEIEETISSLDLDYSFLTMDEITLKTITRSNPGLLLLKDGTIVGKWHYRDYPEILDGEADWLASILEHASKHTERISILLLVAVVILVAAIFRLSDPIGLLRKTNTKSE